MTQKTKRVLFLNLNAMVPLFVGTLFYLDLFSRFVVLRNHLPDMLWSYSLVGFLVLISDKRYVDVVISCCLASLLGTLMETLQLFKVVPGTFDLIDIFLEIVAAIIAAMVILRILGGIFYEVEENNRNSSLSCCFCRRCNSK